MKTINTIIGVVLFGFSCVDNPAWASSKGGTTAVPFLGVGVGARSLAMGEAATGTTEDATALFWNPGALPQIKGQSASFTHTASFENSFYDYAAYAGSRGTSAWGTSIQYFSAGSLDQTNNNGDKTGSLTPHDVAITGAYARSVQGYGLGLSAKYIQSTLLNTARTIAMDGGILSPWFLGNRVRAGVSLANLGGKINYDQESASLPLTFRGGMAVRPGKGWTGAMDVVDPKGETIHLALGAEYQLIVANDFALSVRGGFNSRETGDKTQNLSAGLGFGWRQLTVDYAFVSHGDLDPSQVFSIGYGF